MSQFWHAHWAEDSYKPGLLGNWQVPNWHPKWPCVRHCVTTTFLADKSGRLLPDKPRSKRSPWGDFKGTWELPLKIDRKLANKLSAPPEHKIAAWKAHKQHYEAPCGFVTSPKTNKKKISQTPRRNSPVRIVEKTNKTKARPKSPKIKGKKNEIISKKGKTTMRKSANRKEDKRNATRKSADRKEVKRNATRKSADRKEDKRNATKDVDEKIVAEGLDDQEKTVTEEERSVIEEPEYKKEETVIKESKIEKTDKKIRRKPERTECYCDNELDSHLKTEIVSMPMTNICTIHQRLRV